METALKILNEDLRATQRILDSYKEKLAYAEFTKNVSDIEQNVKRVKDWSSKVKEVKTAISELEELKKLRHDLQENSQRKTVYYQQKWCNRSIYKGGT